jgi:hypothetical protein
MVVLAGNDLSYCNVLALYAEAFVMLKSHHAA